MNHLLVGLGGTGGKVLAAFRRLVLEQYPVVEPPELSIDYLYIDSSAEDTRNANIVNQLKEGDQVWRTLGQSVQLSPAQVVHLEQSAFSHVIGNIDDYPMLKRWIGDTAIWQDLWNSAPSGIEAGGQLRRFGRFLFAQNARRVVQALQDRFSAAGRAQGGVAEADWTVHVIAGLAGGTGSGTVLDLVGQLRKLRPGDDTKIVVYAVLPEVEQTSWAKENYYANGYAALAELNALLVKAYRPSDVLSATDRYSSDKPVDNVFVVTNRNENGLIVSLDKVVPQVVAETLYQIVAASGDAQARGQPGGAGRGADQKRWRDMVRGENDLRGYEKDTENGPDARADRFLSFGIKRVAVPAQEIREYASLIFLRQSMLQLAHNNWTEGLGYVDTSVNFDGAALARADECRVQWRLTDQHLMLESKMLDGDSTEWCSLFDEFFGPLQTKEGVIRSQVRNNDQWLQPLEEFARERYDRGFRRVGVAEFYRVAERSATDRARHIRDRLAADLFERWTNGVRSARDIQRVLEELTIDMQERMVACDRKVQEAKRQEESLGQDRDRSFQQYATWGGRGFLIGQATFSRPQAMSKHARVLAELYASKARQIALAYQRKVLGQALGEVQALLDDVQTVAERLNQAVAIVEKRRAVRVPVDEAANDQAHLFKFYDRTHVRKVVARLEHDKDLQQRQTSALRARLTLILGARPSFRAFVEKLSEWRLVEQLEREAEKAAEVALAEQESSQDRVLEASIFQRLYDEYSGREEDLRRFIADRVLEAGSFAPRLLEHENAGGGSKVGKCIVAFVPAAEELPEELRRFRDDVARIAGSAASGAELNVVEVRGRPHEIVFLSLVNRFPLRHLQALPLLKQRYDALVDEEKAGAKARRKRLELHTEGDGSTLPSLYPESSEQTRRKARPYWLIAECAELIRERRNAATGEPEVFAVVEDADGGKRAFVFGRDLRSGADGLKLDAFPALQALVDDYLRLNIHIDARTALKKKLIERQNAALEAVDFNEADPGFQSLQQTVQAARALAGAPGGGGGASSSLH